jgi:hypothetical protein
MKDNNLKFFFIKLVSITISIIIIINVVFNLLFSEKLESFNKIFSFTDKNNRNILKTKLMKEMEDSLNKDQILYDEDKKLIYRVYLKLKKEFEDVELEK